MNTLELAQAVAAADQRLAAAADRSARAEAAWQEAQAWEVSADTIDELRRRNDEQRAALVEHSAALKVRRELLHVQMQAEEARGPAPSR
jgi:hypothetical protein